MAFGLRERDLTILIEVLQHYRAIEKAVIFGSRAKNTFRRASDIDLAIYAPGMTSTEFAQLRIDLDEAPLIYELDVIHFDTLTDSELRTKIESDGKIVYQRCAQHGTRHSSSGRMG